MEVQVKAHAQEGPSDPPGWVRPPPKSNYYDCEALLLPGLPFADIWLYVRGSPHTYSAEHH
jgi:hypothetical protein